MKKRVKYLLGIAIVLCLLIVIKFNMGIDLIQLSPNTESQMMGYVIKTHNEKLIIIDGGTYGDTDNLINYINGFGGKVDSWFITHPHKDHASAFIDIVENTDIEIDNVYVSLNSLEWYEQNSDGRFEEIKKFFDVIENGRISNKVHEVSIGENIKIDNLKLEILGIKNPEITKNPINNSSIVMKLKVNDKSILFLGDTGNESSEKLINSTDASLLKSDIVQIAHHGQSGATEDLYKIINPSICLWPTPEWLWNNDCGEGYNSGEWKTLETRSWIESLNVKHNYIAKDGDIKLKIW